MSHTWKFFRSGGLDQVALETGADLLALGELDQELWVALSCPVKGLELDEKTLALIDGDGDGRIGVPDVIAAIRWAGARLNDAGDLLRGAESLPLAAVNVSTPDGNVLVASMKQVLASLGRKDATALSVAEASDTAKIFAANPLTGDGIIPPEATDNEAIQALIKDIIACTGGTTRREGLTGVTAAQVEAFYADLAAYVAWTAQSAGKDIAVLGDATPAAVAAIKAVRTKVDDFFGRTRLAAFDSRAIAALNRNEADYLAIAAKDMAISADEVRGFPLARVEAGRPLPLLEGVNPAWADALAALHAATKPGLAARPAARWKRSASRGRRKFSPVTAAPHSTPSPHATRRSSPSSRRSAMSSGWSATIATCGRSCTISSTSRIFTRAIAMPRSRPARCSSTAARPNCASASTARARSRRRARRISPTATARGPTARR
jgi:hypothetical protein